MLTNIGLALCNVGSAAYNPLPENLPYQYRIIYCLPSKYNNCIKFISYFHYENSKTSRVDHALGTLSSSDVPKPKEIK